MIPVSFQLAPSPIFLKQIKNLSEKDRKLIKQKTLLIKNNPFRFKRIHSKKFSKLFRVRLNINNKETRLIYVVLGSKIIPVCLLNRENDYKDLEKYMSKL